LPYEFAFKNSRRACCCCCCACCCCSYQAANEELFSFSVTDNLIAAGGQGNVHFWDRRTQQQLTSFDDMHMDDVTQVCGAAAGDLWW
jgi:hypothetical protein